MKKTMLALLAACLMLALSPAAADTAETPSLPSLKDTYSAYFDFGSAVGSRELRSADYLAFAARQYAILTPENALKPENVFDAAKSAKAAAEDQGNVALNFQLVKPLLNFAQESGIKVHGHVLFWHNQTPDVFFRESYARTGEYVTRDVMLRRMENYVRETMAYMDANYPGLIVSWDVVNEAIDDSTGGLRESNWSRVVGDDFVLQAFRFARNYAPEGTLLFYNDYSTPYQPKLDGILSLLDELIAENLVDGYGMQCHYQLTTPTALQVELAIRKIKAKGLLLRISEMDILIDDDSDSQLQLQADRYAELIRIFCKYSDSIIAVQTWGTRDSLSWKSGRYPLLFDGSGMPKPAFYALVDSGIVP